MRRAGVRHVELVEDAVQHAMVTALAAWERAVPDDPTAWLYRVAHNKLVQDLRREQGRARILERTAEDAPSSEPDSPVFVDEIRDDMLRMVFVCCQETIPWESQLVLALKTLCGFSTSEIALRLFTSEANVHKRLARARDRLRLGAPEIETPPLETLRTRLAGVHGVLYLLFNEGYLSAHAEDAIRHELCDEATGHAPRRASRRCGSGELRAARADAPACGTTRIARRRDRWPPASRRARSLALGSRARADRHGVAAPVGER